MLSSYGRNMIFIVAFTICQLIVTTYGLDFNIQHSESEAVSQLVIAKNYTKWLKSFYSSHYGLTGQKGILPANK